ncbi:hypothetical protein HZA97_07825 [Candidatus Woesearchaeota archaeon]|nr:hypothetical protein [Candidatus Woesearchaeota archaeon]
MKYFIHQPDHYWILFVGTEKEQIINTVKYYRDQRGVSNLSIPDDSKIKEISKLEIMCTFPMLKVDQFIEAEVREKVKLNVNANAFDHVRYIAQFYEDLKRGDLYKFNPGMPNIDGMYLLPEYIMKGINEYNWDQHSKQIDAWLSERERIIRVMEKDKRFYRP